MWATVTSDPGKTGGVGVRVARAPSRDQGIRPRRHPVIDDAGRLLGLQATAGNRAVVSMLARRPGQAVVQRTPVGATDTALARRQGREHAARIKRAGTLSDADRQAVNERLSFFEGEAKRIYLRELTPTLVAVSRPKPAEIEMPPDPASQSAIEFEQWRTKALAELAAIRADVERWQTVDIPALRQHAENLRAVAVTANQKVTGKQVRSGVKELAKGTMRWSLALTQEGVSPGPRFTGTPSADIQISFTPKDPRRGQTVTFLQTKLQTGGTGPPSKPSMDVAQGGEFEPFYGVDWYGGPKWEPEPAPAQPYLNRPGTDADPTAHLYDGPWVPRGTQKVFEAVAVVSDTAETLGALRWGVAIGRLLDAEPANCTDGPSAEFAAAVDRFYATPAKIGPDPERQENYDAILDGFSPDGAALTADHLKQLDPVAALLVATPTMSVSVAGFGDEHDTDARAASDQRAKAVVDHLVGKGVATSRIRPTGLGSIWARFPVATAGDRNRRVQIRLRY